VTVRSNPYEAGARGERTGDDGLVVGIAADVASERPWPHKLEELLVFGDER